MSAHQRRALDSMGPQLVVLSHPVGARELNSGLLEKELVEKRTKLLNTLLFYILKDHTK